jgi:four helix bundle protein
MEFSGIRCASALGMAPNQFRNLQCWKLADQLRTEVHTICAKPAVSRDFDFCNSFRDAVGSICRNISEGFIRYTSPEIAKFFGYALASLGEVQDHLQECVTKKVLTDPEFQRLWDLSEHVKATSLNFSKPHRERTERERKKRRERKPRT